MSGHLQGFESDLQLRDQSIKESACNAGGPGSIPGLGRSSAEGNGNPLQYSCLDNPMDGGVWQATVFGVTRVGHDLATKLLLLELSVLGAAMASAWSQHPIPMLSLFHPLPITSVF